MHHHLNHYKYFAALLIIATLHLSARPVLAQAYNSRCTNYISSTFEAPFVSIAGAPNTTTIYTNLYYDEDSPTFTFPFDFNYDSTDYPAGTTMYLQNGYINVGSFIGYNNTQDIVSTRSILWTDRICPWSGWVFETDNVLYNVSGSPGSRVATIEYNNAWGYMAYNFASAPPTSFQIKIYETTNVIEFWYQINGFGFNGSQPFNFFGVGIKGSVVDDFQRVGTSSTDMPSSQIRLSPQRVTNIQLSVQPKSLSFGSSIEGITSSPMCIKVKNAGAFGVLNITGVSVAGTQDFQIVNSPATNNYDVGDPPGEYCITFTPSSSGIRTATLQVFSNGKDSGMQTVELTGIGLVGEYSVDSLVKFKKTRIRLGDSLTEYIRITSQGDAPLVIHSITTIGDDADQYQISHFPLNPLPPGITDSIGITYIPTKEGKHTAVIRILSNSFANPSLDISLQGTGILPHIIVTPPIVLFDSINIGDTVCKTVTISNPGSDSLILFTNSLISNDGDFHYTGFNGHAVIPPDQSKSVSVCFIPIQKGERQARLILRTNIIKTFTTPRLDTAGTIFIDIRGAGVPFGILSVNERSPMDSVLVGTRICHTDTLKNTGDADIHITGFTIKGLNRSDFIFSGLPPFPFLLKAHTYQTFSSCETPDMQGLLIATEEISSYVDGNNFKNEFPLSVFGFVPCISASSPSLFTIPQVVLPNDGSDSTICDTITNCGDVAAIYQATISGVSSTDYTVTPSESTLIPPKGTTVFCVVYKPSHIGLSPASLDVVATDGSALIHIPLAAISGCGILTSSISRNPTLGIGTKDTISAVVHNTGTFPVILGSGSIAPSNGPFKFIRAVPDTIDEGGSGIVTIEFNPVVSGNFNAVLTFPYSGPCQDTPVNIILTGSGITNSVYETVPSRFSLEQSFPNPTKGKTAMIYTTTHEANVHLKLVDITGKTVRTLISGRVSGGVHTVNFDVSDMPNGTYAYIIESENIILVRPLILAK